MKRPFDHTIATPREALAYEIKLCFGTAAVCVLAGLVGYGVNQLRGEGPPVAALLVVAVFYVVMAIPRLIKWRFGNPATSSGGGSGH